MTQLSKRYFYVQIVHQSAIISDPGIINFIINFL